jgi:hypothetical protein
MFCQNCGTQLGEFAKYCSACGAEKSLIVASSAAASHPDTSATTSSQGVGGPQGIEGWLTLVALNLIAAPFVLLYQLFTVHFALISSDKWASIPGNLTGLIWFEVIMNIGLIAAVLYIGVLFINKKSDFPKFFIFFLVGKVILLLLDIILASGVDLSPDSSDLAQASLVALIWIPYMRVSKRVRATFVN